MDGAVGAEGEGSDVGDADAAFNTYIAPEPATMTLLVLGGLAVLRRRKTV